MPLATVNVRLAPGRDTSVRNRHPWLFSGAIASVEGGDGSMIAQAEVFDADGRWLARGVFHAEAELAVRLYTWNPDEAIGPEMVARRIQAACNRRAAVLGVMPDPDTDAFRLVHSEADGLSGLVVDRYANRLSVRVGAAAIEAWLDGVLDALSEITGIRDVVVRADADGAARERLDAAAIAARTRGPETAEFRESGAVFTADLAGGQKTGFFLDQRENRRRVAKWARGRRLLSAYCYSGAFEVIAARAGATSIVGIDTSEAALAAAQRHHQLNRTTVPVEYLRADVPSALRRFRDEGRSFDLIVLDPPKFAVHRGQVERALRAYKDINLLAIKLLAPGGVLATFSCSGLVGADLFADMLRWAAADSGRDLRLVERLGQPFDHPVLATCPETGYLIGAIGMVE
ncbi:MAG: class I SAM-dependent rRNA methyltransferase [Kiritimatiellae bacterium]|nr:class I SAM-dependent rRNA methyltransferase [Kiritimatiellia bacterium]